MFNLNEFKGLIVAKGLTQQDVADKLNMSPKTLYLKMQKGVFGTDEMNILIDLLDIKDPMRIFLGREVTLIDTSEE